MSRYRVNKIKRMHSIIDGVLPYLEVIAKHPAVAQVTPGRIQPKRRGTRIRISFQYVMDTGLKLMAHTTEAVQEVFVVTSDPDAVLDFLYSEGVVKRKNGPTHR